MISADFDKIDCISILQINISDNDKAYILNYISPEIEINGERLEELVKNAERKRKKK